LIPVTGTDINTILDRARAYLAAIPPAIAGQGGHDQTFAVACVLVNGFALEPETALALLREYNRHCLPPWSEHELVHKIESAIQATPHKPRGHLLGEGATFRPATRFGGFSAQAASRHTSPNAVDPGTAAENWLRGFRADECDVWEASPIRPPGDYRLDAVCLLEYVFRPGELVNFVTDYTLATRTEGPAKAIPQGHGETVARDALISRWLRAMPSSPAGGWLRMNPLDGQGCRDTNVTAYRFALVEFDTIPRPLQLALLARLPLPIAAILTSGRRSLHAWVRVDAPDADAYRATVARLLKLLARFGTDTRNKNPSRLSRLPGTRRTIGGDADGLQRLLYLNPEPTQKAILV
jgi:hypothetical protein